MKVDVIGAGIGGLTTAVALRKHGIEATVYERHFSLDEAGAGITLGANATRLLDQLGYGAALREVASFPEEIIFHRWDTGDVYCSHRLGCTYANRFGAPFACVFRPDLLNLLLAADELKGAVRYGHTCAQIRPHRAGVDIHFAEHPVRCASVVIAADGIHSALRRHLSDAVPHSSGLIGYRGVVEAAAVPPCYRTPVMHLAPGPGCLLVFYPVSENLLSFNITTTEAPGTIPTVEEAAHPFSRWSPVNADTVRTAPYTAGLSLLGLKPLRRWTDGRFTLLGDAAHGMLPHQGQGACQAIEDAWTIARTLATSTDPETALRSYERIRKARTRQIQIGSRENGVCLTTSDPAEAVARDIRLRNLPDDVAWIHEYGKNAEACSRA